MKGSSPSSAGRHTGADAPGRRAAGALPVFAGASLGLWAIAAVAVAAGAKSLKLLPMPWIRRLTTTILFGFGIYSIITAITGLAAGVR